MADGNPEARFPTTHWSWIAAAGERGTTEARAALADLCRAYWYPIYALIRRWGYAPADASDVTQEYFTRLIEGDLLRAADRTKGRFRTFLQTDCGYFLADLRDRRRATKRGGDSKFFSLDEAQAEGWFRREAADTLDPERLFDRAWAQALLHRAFARLAREEDEAGRGAAFDRLKVVLTDGPRAVPYAEIAEGLGTTVAAVQAAVVRLRGRYREALRSEVAATLGSSSEADIDEEIRSLFAVLAP
jgi:RNA polymerase sigma factor (sigma-70 family)